MKNTGNVFDIQRFSVHDGPGIRTNVFLKGCPLRCVWCHNPEGYRAVSEVMFSPNLCIGCGECTVCPGGAHKIVGGVHLFEHSLCLGNTERGACGMCASVCPTEALRRAGNEMTVDEVIERVLQDSSFYSSGGGMTLSGGEPFYQASFATALLKAAKEKGINTAVETSGYAPKKAFSEALRYIDLLLFDVKLTNEEDHIRYTGVSRAPILENLSAASENGSDIILRCPIIPTVNDTESHLCGIADTAKGLKTVKEIHLEPYHSMGTSKSQQLGLEPLFKTAPPKNEDIEKMKDFLSSITDVTVKISK